MKRIKRELLWATTLAITIVTPLSLTSFVIKDANQNNSLTNTTNDDGIFGELTLEYTGSKKSRYAYLHTSNFFVYSQNIFKKKKQLHIGYDCQVYFGDQNITDQVTSLNGFKMDQHTTYTFVVRAGLKKSTIDIEIEAPDCEITDVKYTGTHDKDYALLTEQNLDVYGSKKGEQTTLLKLGEDYSVFLLKGVNKIDITNEVQKDGFRMDEPKCWHFRVYPRVIDPRHFDFDIDIVNGEFKFSSVNYTGATNSEYAKLSEDNLIVKGETQGSIELTDLKLGVDFDIYHTNFSQYTLITDKVLQDGFVMHRAGTWKFQLKSIKTPNEILDFEINIVDRHPTKPIDGQWFGAEIWIDNKRTHFDSVKEAWEVVNSNDVCAKKDVSFILFEDWVANADGDFTTLDGGVIRPHPRAKAKYKLTIDLNGFQLNGDRTYRESIKHGVLELRVPGNFTIKNGTICNGKTYTNGAGVYLDCDDCTATLENLTITGNETIGGGQHHNNGGGIYVQKCLGRFALDNVTITDNKASGFGGGVYCNTEYIPFFGGGAGYWLDLKNKIIINGNTGSGGRNNLILRRRSCNCFKVFTYPEVVNLTPGSKIGLDFSDQEYDNNTAVFNLGTSPCEHLWLKVKDYFFIDSPVHNRHFSDNFVPMAIYEVFISNHE